MNEMEGSRRPYAPLDISLSTRRISSLAHNTPSSKRVLGLPLCRREPRAPAKIETLASKARRIWVLPRVRRGLKKPGHDFAWFLATCSSQDTTFRAILRPQRFDGGVSLEMSLPLLRA